MRLEAIATIVEAIPIRLEAIRGLILETQSAKWKLKTSSRTEGRIYRIYNPGGRKATTLLLLVVNTNFLLLVASCFLFGGCEAIHVTSFVFLELP